MYERYIKDRWGLLRPPTAHPYLGDHQLSPGSGPVSSLSPPYPTGPNFLPIWSLTEFIKIFTIWLQWYYFSTKSPLDIPFHPWVLLLTRSFPDPLMGVQSIIVSSVSHTDSHTALELSMFSLHTSRSPWHIPFSPSKCSSLLSFDLLMCTSSFVYQLSSLSREIFFDHKHVDEPQYSALELCVLCSPWPLSLLYIERHLDKPACLPHSSIVHSHLVFLFPQTFHMTYV